MERKKSRGSIGYGVKTYTMVQPHTLTGPAASRLSLNHLLPMRQQNLMRRTVATARHPTALLVAAIVTVIRAKAANIRKSDIELINTRVVRKDFKLPTFDDLETGDVTYACYTNAERNLICENIFASILEKRHPKAEENFDIPQGTLIIKGKVLILFKNKSVVSLVQLHRN